MKISLKAARVNANLTQKEVAEVLGVHEQTYLKMEQNPEDIAIKDAMILCRLFNAEIADIFFGADSN